MINAKLLQLVIEASNDGIVVAEQEGDDNILIYANPAFERLTGYTVDEILYQDCRFLQDGDRDQPGLAAIRRQVAANRLTTPLFDTASFARDFDELLLAIWRHHLAGGTDPLVLRS